MSVCVRCEQPTTRKAWVQAGRYTLCRRCFEEGWRLEKDKGQWNLVGQNGEPKTPCSLIPVARQLKEQLEYIANPPEGSLAKAIGKAMFDQYAAFTVWANQADVECPNCHLKHLGDCPFVMGKPCVCCGEPVTEIGLSGDIRCRYCDANRCYEKPKTPRCIETHRRTWGQIYEDKLQKGEVVSPGLQQVCRCYQKG